MKRSKQFTEILLKATDGLVGTVTDTVLMMIYFTLASPGRTSSYDMDQLVRETHEFVDSVNYKTIKNALYTLKKNGQISRSVKRTTLEIEITQEGRKRIAQLFPQYREKRPWDGHIYLISYDIPINANSKRALFRIHLHKTGCALLQASLWITPYAPQGIIQDFVSTYAPGGTILISKLGKDGAIGDETVPELVTRVYHLEDLARRYLEFIEKYEMDKRAGSPAQCAVEYFSILKDDPQLPFALLPQDFPCKHAHELFESSIIK
jgi:DNA-binding transcriptional regulator PaaX